jgi:hypothetical protein
LVISESDIDYEKQIQNYGVDVYKTDIIMENEQDEIKLSNHILKLLNNG